MTQEQVQQLLDINVALSAERDREALLTYILDTAMDMTNCDGGTLYLLKDNALHFCRMVTRSFGIRQGGHDAPITLPPVPLKPSHVCARAVLENHLINVSDVHANTEFDFSGSKKYDELTGYCTRSMLVVPLANDYGELIGVLQLLNAKNDSGESTEFTLEMEPLVTAMASQAAISLTNMQYSEQIHALLDSLVGSLSAAIDQRTPYNANHTRNMARYAEEFLDWLAKTNNQWQFTTANRRAFLLSVWLHDVGKLVVPLNVMDKETRLGSAEKDVEHRFKTMNLLNRIDMLEGRITAEQEAARKEELDETLTFIRKVNNIGFLPDSDLEKICDIAKRTYVDENGIHQSWLSENEFTSLSVRKGTLTAEEREIMESHVQMTSRILSEMAFPKMYNQVPTWAGAHHELLNGHGYPKHISGEEIPKEVRLLTLLDIFDALTARDRPYKPGMPVEKAFAILDSMVNEGSIDGEILTLFKQSKAWEVLL